MKTYGICDSCGGPCKGKNGETLCRSCGVVHGRSTRKISKSAALVAKRAAIGKQRIPETHEEVADAIRRFKEKGGTIKKLEAQPAAGTLLDSAAVLRKVGY